jgi:hypothetical protein
MDEYNNQLFWQSIMNRYEDGYEATMEQTNSFNWEPPLFVRDGMEIPRREVRCWRCHKHLTEEFSYYCVDCEMEAKFGYWGA